MTALSNKEVGEFFSETEVYIYGNLSLREPQRDGYDAIVSHFGGSGEACYVQLPVGCGKTGLMGITPFALAQGRVLIIAPNLTIRKNIYNELNISNSDCFYPKRNVFVPKTGPFIAVLKKGANKSDCEKSHMVVANIQQFAGEKNRWYESFPDDYFDVILVDEGHHNVADTWRRLFSYFSKAKVISYTATPRRADGLEVSGKRVYAFGYTRAMLLGMISPIQAVFIEPDELTFTIHGKEKTYNLEEVLKMREKDWFSKGIALSEECNKHIVAASLEKLAEVRKLGGPRQIIAAACSIRHAHQIAALYHSYGMSAKVLSYESTEQEEEEINAQLKHGLLDVVVQVQKLGEGYDCPSLSVAAVFRPFRSLSPYIQFVGRILRLAIPDNPSSPGNMTYLVSHVGLNDERWWDDFKEFDKEDQGLAQELSGRNKSAGAGASTGDGQLRLRLSSFIEVLNEVVSTYSQHSYLTAVDSVMVDDVLQTLRDKGYDPSEFGLTEDIMKRRLESDARARETRPLTQPVAQPQKEREGLRKRVYQEARSIADVVVNRFGFKHAGRDLLRVYPGLGNSNVDILVNLASKKQNAAMGVESKARDNASLEQFRVALESSDKIADELEEQLKERFANAQKS